MIIVEDGTEVANANSYVSESDLATYASARGITIASEDLEMYLIRSMDYIESLRYIGTKATDTQSLQWPRLNVVIDGYDFPSDEIPKELKNGQMAVAVATFQGYDPLQPTERAIKRKKTDVLETEYMDNSVTSAYAKTINASLYKLLRGGGGSMIEVKKG